VAIRQEGWQKNWGRKIRINATSISSALIFLPVEGPGQTSSIKPRITDLLSYPA
jgi:hypothetical protein